MNNTYAIITINDKPYMDVNGYTFDFDELDGMKEAASACESNLEAKAAKPLSEENEQVLDELVLMGVDVSGIQSGNKNNVINFNEALKKKVLAKGYSEANILIEFTTMLFELVDYGNRATRLPDKELLETMALVKLTA